VTRIDPIIMLDAYLFTAIKPTWTTEFIYRDIGGMLRGCPLAVISLALKGKQHDDVAKYDKSEYGLVATAAFGRVICDSPAEWPEAAGVMRRVLDISKPYQHGFMWGYDRWPLDPLWVAPWHPDYDIGYADGGLCKAVLDARDYKIYLA
jgi:hypothetical protein